MKKVRIGIINEGKTPPDRRTPLPPMIARQAMDQFPDLEIVCETSNIRCFTDEEYENEGIEVVQSLEDCDVIMGVKEVPIDNLLEDKTFFFFSHTIKAQPYNRELLRQILAKNIRLIDYECLIDADKQRVVAFGRWAGIVGAYNAIWTFGERYNLFHLRRANQCYDYEDLKTEYDKIHLPPVKIAVTGGGRVAKGVIEVLTGMDILRVTPANFLTEIYHEPVFTQLNNRDYHQHKEHVPFNRGEFFKHPEHFDSTFINYARETDLLIAAAYWDPKAPVLFTLQEMVKNDFRIHVVADITCDIEGSIPSTKMPSTIDEPVYDFDPTQNVVQPAFSDEGNVSVMAIDNLPCELPRDSSEEFGRMLHQHVLPGLAKSETKDPILRGATIAENGVLTEPYRYLEDYVAGR